MRSFRSFHRQLNPQSRSFLGGYQIQHQDEIAISTPHNTPIAQINAIEESEVLEPAPAIESADDVSLCHTCRNHIGQVLGESYFCCAIHPSGIADNCLDWESKETVPITQRLPPTQEEAG